MRIALFGGTFDPIHHGHLILARDAIEQLTLDRVIFIPAALSPHKPSLVPAPSVSRRAMIMAAIEGEPHFTMDECELHRFGPSYTIDTVELMHSRFASAELFYLIGHDNSAKLDTWHRIDDLRRLVQFVILDRDANADAPAGPRIVRRIDISATDIRQRVKRGLSIRYLVPDAVRHIIARDHLYQESSH
jgi:nicotinate-nucleotide adenylyltransferase